MMLYYKPTLQAALNTILPTYYELFVDSTTTPPCITYYESGDSQDLTGNTLGYSRKSYTIKAWGTSIKDMSTYYQQIDAKMRSLGFTRQSYNEMTDDNLVCLIGIYQGLGKEDFI